GLMGILVPAHLGAPHVEAEVPGHGGRAVTQALPTAIIPRVDVYLKLPLPTAGAGRAGVGVGSSQGPRDGWIERVRDGSMRRARHGAKPGARRPQGLPAYVTLPLPVPLLPMLMMMMMLGLVGRRPRQNPTMMRIRTP